MRLSRHIERLLLTENIVVVPDFGCFVAHEMPAHYDAQERAFFPSVRTLGFSAKGVVNDYALVQSYADVYDLSLPDAIKEVAKDVDEVKAELFAKGVYRFEGVGELSYANNAYDFKPELHGLLTPSVYGLGVLEIEKIGQQNVFAKPDNDPVVITIRRSTVHKCVAAAAVAAIALLSVVPMKYASSNLEKIQTASMFNLARTSVKVSPVKEDKVEKAVEKTVTVRPKKVVKQELAPVPDAENAKFTIVLAAGVSQEGAAKYADSLRTEGINASVTEGKYPQVVYGKYATSADAQNEIAKHAEHPCFSVAWIKRI